MDITVNGVLGFQPLYGGMTTPSCSQHEKVCILAVLTRLYCYLHA